MKIVLDKAYTKSSIYTIITVTILYILYGIISHLGVILSAVLGALGSLLSLLAPLIIALVITYLLHPVVSWIETLISKYIKFFSPPAGQPVRRQQLRRTLSVLITYLLILSVIVIFIYFLYVLISGSLPKNLDINTMLNGITSYSKTYDQLFTRLTAYLQSSGISAGLKNQLLALLKNTQLFISSAGSGLLASLAGFFSNLLNLVMGLIIAFYFLKDIHYFIGLYYQGMALWLPRSPERPANSITREINGVISSFIRGQLLVALIVGVMSSIALYLVGLDYAVMVGMTAGFCNIIPYVGPLIGSVLAIIVALLSGSPMKAVFAVVALIVVQQLDGNIISPKVVGDSVGLHPVFVILAIIIGGSWFGLLGMLLAVPAAGILKLLLLRWVTAHKTAAGVED